MAGFESCEADIHDLESQRILIPPPLSPPTDDEPVITNAQDATHRTGSLGHISVYSRNSSMSSSIMGEGDDYADDSGHSLRKKVLWSR
jgi:hypothetical protein